MSELSKNRAFYKNTAMLYVMTGAKYILPFVIAACLTRRLGPESYGVIAYLNTVMGFFLLLFDFGFNLSATKAISQHRDDPELIQEKIGQVMTAKCILVAAGARKRRPNRNAAGRRQKISVPWAGLLP